MRKVWGRCATAGRMGLPLRARGVHEATACASGACAIAGLWAKGVRTTAYGAVQHFAPSLRSNGMTIPLDGKTVRQFVKNVAKIPGNSLFLSACVFQFQNISSYNFNLYGTHGVMCREEDKKE